MTKSPFLLRPAVSDTDYSATPGVATVIVPFPNPPTSDQRVSTDQVGVLIKNLSTDADALSLVRRFCQAYEYRASFDWLGESGKLPGRRNRNGVAYALRAALAKYNPSWNEELGKSWEPSGASDSDTDEGRWLDEFAIAATEAVKDELSITQFAWAVTEAEQCDDFDEVPNAVLRKHLLAALKQYAHHYKSGTSPEPW